MPLYAQQTQVAINNTIDTAFVENLRAVGFPVDEILQQKTISRYDVTRLLNAVECVDCLNPGQNMIDIYTPWFRSDFVIRPWEDFRDILFKEAFYREGSYYYCVAYAADNEYMNGYPIATSPICWWLFCGAKDTTKAEFLQIIMNVIEKYTFQNYSVNWSQVQKWKDNLEEWWYADRYVLSIDDDIIDQWVLRCGTTECPLKDRREYKTYRKYCMFELEKCGNQPYGFLKAWRWPIAEINQLAKEWIINEPNIQDSIHDPVDGEYVLATFGRMFPIIWCEFDNDYDCDNISNASDSCPNHYNPQQRDLDQDGIGNVCDPDIDGDTVTNPIGIVDDNDSIIISKYEDDMDNCLFTQNTEQLDRNANKIGDICEGLNESVSLWIRPIIEEEKWPLSVSFVAETEWNYTEIERDFWSNISKNGKEVSHTFEQAWVYTVIAKAYGLRNDAVARTTVIVGYKEETAYAISPQTSSLAWPAPFATTIQHNVSSDTNLVQTEILINGTKEKKINGIKPFNKIFRDPWIYPITTSLKQGEKILAVAQHTIGVGGTEIWSMINTDSLLYNIGDDVNFLTILGGEKENNPIDSIEREFGDGDKIITRSLSHTKQFDKAWPSVAIQRIIFEDGTIHQNFITLFISDPDGASFNNQNIALEASPWFGNGKDPTQLIINEFQINDENVIKKLLRLNDAESQEITESQIEYLFSQQWVHYPKISYYLDQCRSLHSQSTIVVSNPHSCLAAKINGTLGQYKCDFDEDGIPDVCDEDIDNDGVPNLVGAILFENDDCSFSWNINKGVLNDHIEWVCSIDNCPFVSNTDQIDLNNDGLWDVCPDLIKLTDAELDPSEKDTDGDGYTDDRDACPTLPETYNNVEDSDGCPEIGADDPCINEINGVITPESETFINALNCNACPCHFADFGGILKEWDKVRAILTDKPWSKDYTRSFPKVIE